MNVSPAVVGARADTSWPRTGRSVQERITERRMAESRRLRADTDLPVAEVARRVRVDDPGYFSRMFRRAHAVSPREWRERPC